MHIYGEMYYRTWLRWLWRPGSSTIYTYKPENPNTWWCDSVWIRRPENQEHQWQRAGEDGSQLEKTSQRALSLPLLFLPSVDWKLATHVGENHLLYTLLIQMLTSCRNTYTDTLRNNVFLATWASFTLVKLTITLFKHFFHIILEVFYIFRECLEIQKNYIRWKQNQYKPYNRS